MMRWGEGGIAVGCSDWLAVLNILVAFIGVLFVALAVSEYTRLARLRQDFKVFREQWIKDQHRFQKAQQRVMASYAVTDIDRRIQLLSTAVEADPGTFNGYNALGYAYLDKGDLDAAQDAFTRALQQHPDVKEGYFDMARFFLKKGRKDLCKQYLAKAIERDPSSSKDIAADKELFAIYSDNR
jgi:tetratricopeptide (TPR) repeat protein